MLVVLFRNIWKKFAKISAKILQATYD